jgi:hypothetical protein
VLAAVVGALVLAATAVALGPALRVTSPPAINGTAQQGFALHETHGSYSYFNGTYGVPVTPQSFTYQWERCDVNGNGCVSIAGATTRDYDLTSEDVGHTIRVLEKGHYTPPGQSTQYTATGRSAHTTVVSPPGGPTITVTTERVKVVTARTAALRGSINTAGKAVTWQFQFGRTTNYNKGTPIQTISSGATSPTKVSWTLKRLKPDTLYHYRLVAIYTSGGRQTTTYGQDLTFTTNTTGKFLLLSRRLKVAGGFVAVPLKCQSQLKCVSQFTITAAARIVKGKTGATIICAVKVARLKPGQRATVRVRVRRACMKRLHAAKRHRLKAKFTTRPRTGQGGVIAPVTLFL